MLKWAINLLNRFGQWRYERRFGSDTAITLVSGLVGEPSKPLSISRCKNATAKPRLSQQEAREELKKMAGEYNADPKNPAYMLREWDTKAPGYVTRHVYNDEGKVIKEVTVPIEEITDEHSA